MTLRTFSYGGGKQSNAALVLAARGVIDFQTFLFANVGDDSEDPKTLVYVREIAKPYAEHHGIELSELQRIKRDGAVETLWQRLMKEESRSIPIPLRMSRSGAPGTRSCTADFKIRVIGKHLKKLGATKDDPAVVGIGISRDEIHRANGRRGEGHERIVYPLVSVGEDTGLNMSRADCDRLVQSEPLPAELADRLRPIVDTLPPVSRADLIRTGFTRMPRPPKSACFFCPLHQIEAWREQRRTEPDLFAKSCQLEGVLNERRDMLGKDPVYLSSRLRVLSDAIPDESDQGVLFEDDDGDGSCDSGWCMT